MSRTTATRANAVLAAPRKLLDDYLREAASRLAARRQVVGNQIRKARETKGLLQKELAARVHVEPQTVSNWERGVSTPDFDKLEVLARELGQPLAFFVVEKPPAAAEAEAIELRQVAAEAAENRVLLEAIAAALGLDPAELLRDARLPDEERPSGESDAEHPGEAAQAV